MLKLDSVTKIFHAGTINERIALDDFSFHLKKGEFVAVIGGNGAGKSTLLNTIAGVYTPDYGSVFVDGKDVTKYPEHKRAKLLGRVFQDPMLGTCANMGIEENLAMASRRSKKLSLRWAINHTDRAAFAQKVQMLDLGLESRLKSKVGLLSGGQRQALTLLMATIEPPKVLLLDEHTAALDPKTAKKVLEITDAMIRQDQLTALMITHNMKDAIMYGNRLIMMADGKILLDICGEEKKKLTVKNLLERFEGTSAYDAFDDKLLLSK